jgi:hypothetical protein
MFQMYHYQEVWELVVMVGVRLTVHIHVESPLLVHHSWRPCSQLSEIVDFENVAGR